MPTQPFKNGGDFQCRTILNGGVCIANLMPTQPFENEGIGMVGSITFALFGETTVERPSQNFW